ncbi:MAG TPA: hypothetical protein PLV13_08010 [Ilumatobacteraceae bacterium]|nr:hypothetical protein [Ilumatobacteraceae bacterium]
MNPLQLGASVALLVASALWALARSVRRAPISLAAARRQMVGAPVSVGDSFASAAATSWVMRRHGVGLRAARLSAADVATRAVGAAAMMGVAVLAAIAGLLAAGLLPLSPLWLVMPVVTAALAGWTMVRDAVAKGERAQVQLRRAANDFVQLVAVGLTTDQSVEEAVRFAVGVGAGPGFELLREAMLAAPQRGVPLWEALDDFGQYYDVRELSEFAGSLERQGLQGVSIGDTVAAMATAMRAKALDQLERDADRANANLSGPTVGFVVATIVFLAYPLAQRISEAFGG